MDEEDIVERAQLILQTINSVFDENGVSLPERQYITVGETAHDCEQVTVAFTSSQLGLPSGGGGAAVVCTGNLPTTAIFTVQIVRCVPAPGGTVNTAVRAPSAKALDDSGMGFMRDSSLLLKAGYQAIESTWSMEGSADVTLAAPSGAYQAITMSISTVI